MLLVGLDDVEDGDEEPIFGDSLLDYGGAAVRTGDLLVGVVFEEFLQTGGATAVLIHAHHHGGVVLGVELTHAEEALQFHFALQQGLDLLGHASSA